MVDLPIIAFESQAAWEAWLEDNHASHAGIWAKIAKKDSGHQTADYQALLTGALCYGWIDGQKNKFDEQYWLQKFTPRRKKSIWSQVNCQKALDLIAQGVMRPAGLLEVERAQQDGRWDAAYAPQSSITVPEDFQAALDANPSAKAFFETLKSANRYSFLFRVTTAKKPETRQKRIQEFVEKLARQETFQ
jgi:uncharacterized protein YdeI (YjbR/CyaY-like superfamily)